MVRTRTDTRPDTPLDPEPQTPVPSEPANPEPNPNLIQTPVNRTGLVIEEPTNPTLMVDRQLALAEIARQYARPPSVHFEPLLADPSDVSSVCAFLNFVSKNTGHGVWWTNEIEKWISNNLKPDSTASLKFEAYL